MNLTLTYLHWLSDLPWLSGWRCCHCKQILSRYLCLTWRIYFGAKIVVRKMFVIKTFLVRGSGTTWIFCTLDCLFYSVIVPMTMTFLTPPCLPNEIKLIGILSRSKWHTLLLVNSCRVRSLRTKMSISRWIMILKTHTIAMMNFLTRRSPLRWARTCRAIKISLSFKITLFW